MTQAKYTPGPWSTGGNSHFKTVLKNAKGESIASGGNNRSIMGEELEASLALAAAAPELLEALRNVTDQLRTIQWDHKERWSNERTNLTSAYLLQAKKAIDKAVGAA